jgi:hypothetical protein
VSLISQDKVAKEGQSGKTAFSQGGVNGPNKLEGLVGYGNLKPGPKHRCSFLGLSILQGKK